MIAAEPDVAEWHNLLANCLVGQGRLGESIEEFRHAERLAPENLNFVRRLGDLLRRSSNLAEAEEVYRRAIALHPADAGLHYLLAECLSDQNRVEEAVAAALEGVKLDPFDPAAKRTLGNMLRRQSKFAEAEDIFRQAIKLAPGDASLHSGLSDCLDQLGRQPEALEARRETVKLRPQEPQLLASLGHLLLRYHQTAEAEKYLRDAVALAPDMGLYRFWLSQCLAGLGRDDEAVVEVRRALDLEPENSNYRRTLANLLVRSDTQSYSQCGEDILLARIFAEVGNGFYVDVGCNHPEKISNTYLLYQRGWSGICVDPHEVFAPLYREFRPRDVFLPMAVSATKTSLDIFYGAELGLSSAKQQHHLVNKVTVPARKLRDILDERDVARDFELLSVDVEGFEIDVLESLDFSVYRPRIIVAEYNGGSVNLELLPFLVGKGYQIIAVTEYNFVATSRFDLDFHACRNIK